MYNGLNIIVDAFEKQIFDYEGRPKVDVDYDSDTYNLTHKKLQMFKKFFEYDNPSELRDALIDVDEKNIMSLKMILKLHKMF